MSSENQPAVDQENSRRGPSKGASELTNSYQTKLEVHYRDQYRCLCCRRSFDKDGAEHLDGDHIVPQGSGGATLHANLASLCRDCHEAKHEDDEIAPTIEFTSTGNMTDEEFRWYRHFCNEILPALTEVAIGHRVEPLVGLRDQSYWDGWHIPMGAIRMCDERLSDRDDANYSTMEEHRYR